MEHFSIIIWKFDSVSSDIFSRRSAITDWIIILSWTPSNFQIIIEKCSLVRMKIFLCWKLYFTSNNNQEDKIFEYNRKYVDSLATNYYNYLNWCSFDLELIFLRMTFPWRVVRFTKNYDEMKRISKRLSIDQNPLIVVLSLTADIQVPKGTK